MNFREHHSQLKQHGTSRNDEQSEIDAHAITVTNGNAVAKRAKRQSGVRRWPAVMAVSAALFAVAGCGGATTVLNKANAAVKPVQKPHAAVVHIKALGLLPIGVVGNTLTVDSSGNLYQVGGYTGVYSVESAYRLTPSQIHYPLPERTHDTGAGFIGKDLYILGGGQATSVSSLMRIQQGVAGYMQNLATPVSDAVVLPYQGGLLMVGGYDGTNYNRMALLFQLKSGQLVPKPFFQMAVPVRYAGVAQSSGTVYMVGGETASSGLNSGIYMWHKGMKQAKLIGHMPFGVEKAALFTDGQNLVIAGGMQSNGVPMQTIWGFNLATKKLAHIGKLPVPLADMGYTQYKYTGYLAGGMKSSSETDTNQEIYKVSLQ